MAKKACVNEAKVLLCGNCEAENPTMRILERCDAGYDERFYCGKDCARARHREMSAESVRREIIYLKKLGRKHKETVAYKAIVASVLTYDSMLKRNTDLYLRFKAKAEIEWGEVLDGAKDDKSLLWVAKEMKRWSDMCLCAQAYVDLPVEPDSDEAVLVD